jgi:hypothetical protein
MKAISAATVAFLAFVALVHDNAVAADPPVARFEIPIVRDRVPPELRRLKVREGDRVILAWTAEEPMTVHVEGYDIVATVLPGKPATMEFDARRTGRFPIHGHASSGASGGHGHGHRALSHIEVHPK